jgi:hypothetical protein
MTPTSDVTTLQLDDPVELGDELNSLADEPTLRPIRPILLKIAQDLPDDPHGNWRGIDPAAALTVDLSATGSTAVSRAVQVLDIARSALIFAPIFITWLGIGLAARAYASAVAADPSISSQSFIALWEQGFGPTAPFSITLGIIAITDAILIASLIATTIASSVITTRDERRHDDILAAISLRLVAARTAAANMLSRSASAQFIAWQNALSSHSASVESALLRVDDLHRAAGLLLQQSNDAAASLAPAAASILGAVTVTNDSASQLTVTLDNTSDVTRAAASTSAAVADELRALVDRQTSVASQVATTSADLEQLSQHLLALAGTAQPAVELLTAATHDTVDSIEQLIVRIESLERTRTDAEVEITRRLTEARNADDMARSQITRDVESVTMVATTALNSVHAGSNEIERVLQAAANTAASLTDALALSSQERAGFEERTERALEAADRSATTIAAAVSGIADGLEEIQRLISAVRYETVDDGSPTIAGSPPPPQWR